MLHWRVFVRACTEHRVAERIPDMAGLRAALREVFARYHEPPQQQTKRLVELLLTGDSTALDELMSVAVAHQDDPDIYIDDIARVPGTQLRAWVTQFPERAAEIAGHMSWHLVSSPWRDRDRQYAGTPLGFVLTIMQTLVENKHLGYAQDVASKFFAADAHWDHALQRQRTIDWLAALTPPPDHVMARA